MTSKPISDLGQLLASMQPELNEGVYVYATLPPDADAGKIPALASFREKEGLTLIVEEAVAVDYRLPVLFRAAWITLSVHSDLQAVGLTAAFAGALGAADISCNVVAAAYHDHIFVPVETADKAMTVLRRLQEGAARGDPEDIDWGRR
jgi:hypothetical protein